MCRFSVVFAGLFLALSSACWSQELDTSQFKTSVEPLEWELHQSLSPEQNRLAGRIFQLYEQQSDALLTQLEDSQKQAAKLSGSLDQQTAAFNQRTQVLTWSLAGVSVLAILEAGLLVLGALK